MENIDELSYGFAYGSDSSICIRNSVRDLALKSQVLDNLAGKFSIQFSGKHGNIYNVGFIYKLVSYGS